MIDVDDTGFGKIDLVYALEILVPLGSVIEPDVMTTIGTGYVVPDTLLSAEERDTL